MYPFLNYKDLGHEEHVKSGYSIKIISTLDVDFKEKHVSTEELSHALGTRIKSNVHTSQVTFGLSRFSVIAYLWDRSCDLALIVGTFIRGLGKYESMKNYKELPFCRRIDQFIISDSGSAQVFRSFRVATRSAIKLFDDALSAAKCKDQDEAHDSVAAAVAASKLVSDQGSII